jgi:hypothetical protein
MKEYMVREIGVWKPNGIAEKEMEAELNSCAAQGWRVISCTAKGETNSTVVVILEKDK